MSNFSTKIIQSIFYNNPDGYPPIINGTRLLCKANFEVDILCRRYGRIWDIAYPSAAQVRRLSMPNHSSWREYAQFVAVALREARKDAHVFIGHDMHGLLPARLLAARYGRPLIYHCHDFAENGRKLSFGSHIVRWFERHWARTADLVIVPDGERATVIQDQLSLPNAPLVVANAPLKPTTKEDSLLAEVLKGQGRQFSHIVLRQGRIGSGHAIEATVRSLPHWHNHDWGFVVIGPGDTEYLQYLQTLAIDLNLAEQFVILPPVAYDQISSYTAGADLGHTLYEPIHINNQYITTASNKLMEYMAAGLPLLVSDQQGLRQFVEQYHCGLTADASSPENIANAINTLLGNPDLVQRMGRAASEAFLGKFTYTKQFAPVVEKLEAFAKRTGYTQI